MADTRNEIYSATENSVTQSCTSTQESPHKIVGMKVNAAESSGKEENNDTERDKPFCHSSHMFPSVKTESPVLSTSRLGMSFSPKPFALRQSAFGSAKFGGLPPTSSVGSPKKPLLCPSQLSVGSSDTQQSVVSSTLPESSTSSSPFISSNPFSRVPAIADHGTDSSKSPGSDKLVEDNVPEEKEDVSTEVTSEKTTPTKPQVENKLLTTPKFVPLGSPVSQKDEPSSSLGSVPTTSTVAGFVFGQNLHERVEVGASGTSDKTKSKTDEISTNNGVDSSPTSNQTSEMLFSSVIRKELSTEGKCNNSNESEKPSKSLSEAAREYEEARAVKRKYEEVAVVTGEEDEINVLQFNCKLFAFDKLTSTWVERGRGNLRLNDKDGPDGFQSRVVIRTTGSLRVVLNTKIWSGMVVDRASAKSVRLTAMDATGQIKVFLVMASPKEIEKLYHALASRVNRKRQMEAESNDKLGDENEPSSCNSSTPEPIRKRPSLQLSGSSNEAKAKFS